jgi:hypothetical protein
MSNSPEATYEQRIEESVSFTEKCRYGNQMIAISRERGFWMEETTTALGFSYFQRSENVLDIRRGVRLIPSAHHFMAADNNSFNGIGADLSADDGNTGDQSGGNGNLRSVGGRPGRDAVN